MHKHKNPPLAHKDFLHVCKLETVASGQFIENLSDFLSDWGGGVKTPGVTLTLLVGRREYLKGLEKSGKAGKV